MLARKPEPEENTSSTTGATNTTNTTSTAGTVSTTDMTDLVVTATPNQGALARKEAAFTEVLDWIHRKATRATVKQQAQTLQDLLTAKLTVYITGVATVKTVSRWVSEDVQTIHPDNAQRLATAYEIVQLISHFESPRVAKAWLVGLNPQLDYATPAEAIRSGKLRDAFAAAKLFVALG